jgi:hypothetical protein
MERRTEWDGLKGERDAVGWGRQSLQPVLLYD